MQAKVIGPNEDRPHALPEGEFEKPYREKPRGEPEPAGERMVFNLNFLHTHIIYP